MILPFVVKVMISILDVMFVNAIQNRYGVTNDGFGIAIQNVNGANANNMDIIVGNVVLVGFHVNDGMFDKLAALD